MTEQTIHFFSHILGRSMEVAITGHWGRPILMFPTSMGSVYQNRDSGLLKSIEHEINIGKVKVYNVETIDGDSFYNKGMHPGQKIYNYELYTKFLLEELIPFIQKECSTHRIGIVGCSFGAFHALNMALKYPDLFDFAIGMSGQYDIKSFLNGHYDDFVYFNNPVDYMQNAESWKFNHLRIVLGTSDWDICRDGTLNLSQILGNKKINHWFDEKRWAKHDWPLWNMAFPEYLNKVIN
jgi:esterase/lipase superfamily enzyme